MTQLFINGQEVVLPEKFTCKRVSENPFFTKAGDYTLNITLSLLNPINAAIYKHINRLQSLSRFENRTAILVADNVVIIKGKEVVLKYSNEDIEIQIVAGNSSLNYLIGNDLKIRNLDLGAAAINANTIVADLNKTYPQVNWLLLPFYDPDRKFIGNRYTYTNENGALRLKYAYDGLPLSIFGFYGDKLFEASSWFMLYQNYRPQPFFCFIIEKVMTALGYALDNAIARHEIYNKAYIVHAQDTLKFAKMLPDWTVEKFFSEIEKLFDCTLLVDNHAMRVSILFNHKYYENSPTSEVIALDDFEAEIDESPDERMIYEKNIAYNLPDSTYYKYQNTPETILKKSEGLQLGAATDEEGIRNIVTSINRFNGNPPHPIDVKAWLSNSLQFIDKRENGKIVPHATNDYCPKINNPTAESIDESFDIIPAEFESKHYMIRTGASVDMERYMILQMPVARCHEEPAFNAQIDGNTVYPRVYQYMDGETAIAQDEDKKASTYTQLSLAFYNCHRWSASEGKAVGSAYDGMPLSYVRGISERVDVNTGTFMTLLKKNDVVINPLSLYFLHSEFYQKNIRIDKTKTYKIRFVTNSKQLDAKSIFMINNKKFYCKKIESTITNEGIDEIFEGEFFGEKS